MTEWQKSDWRKLPRVQMPAYPDEAALIEIERELSNYPPLVFAGEARDLKAQLAAASRGKAFLLQGGDCAESFKQFSANGIRDTFKILLQMAIILTYGAKVPVIKLGRMAGQFAKPRSEPTEVKDGLELPTFRGDIINDAAFNFKARMPDPQKMIKAYMHSAATLNLVRAFSKGGYADMSKLHSWTLSFTENERAAEYRKMANQIRDALEFMGASGIAPNNSKELQTVDFYVSHEALLLEYEEALTRLDSTSGNWLAGSGHLIWIGDRTRQPYGAHVEFCRGVQNPIGLKCGPTMTCDDLKLLMARLNPENEAGRITLIARFGAKVVGDHLPRLIKAVQDEGANVLWSCDAMHGNTIKSPTGLKTRPFESVRSEIQDFFAIHSSEGTIPGGVHLEITGQNVTECTGGVYNISDEDLSSRYLTALDPRLNASQALELAFLVADELVAHRKFEIKKTCVS